MGVDERLDPWFAVVARKQDCSFDRRSVPRKGFSVDVARRW
jgi:hypothetical protein